MAVFVVGDSDSGSWHVWIDQELADLADKYEEDEGKEKEEEKADDDNGVGGQVDIEYCRSLVLFSAWLSLASVLTMVI